MSYRTPALWLAGAGLAVALGGGALVVFGGYYNVAASDEHTAPVEWLLHTTMENSVARRAEGIDVPDLDDPESIARGAASYEAMCSACHLRPGMEDTVLRTGMNPLPPDLTQGSHLSPAEQFWVIKNGIKMSGMPAWGASHDDEALWELTAFLQQLPGMSDARYDTLVKGPERESDTSHPATGGDGHDHEHGEMSAMMGEPETGTGTDDGHDHTHGDDNHTGENAPMPDEAATHHQEDEPHAH
ncbi:MAG: ketosteroid isomerase-like enzyme [Halomonadaceae bacterium T82-2]|nr:MAG: ketosteroid isomerase-like enzyme [Halomonadaceae bacterium T82-2]